MRYKRTLNRIERAIHEEGVRFLINAACIKLFDYSLGYYYFKYFYKNIEFTFNGKQFCYFCKRYNKTWRNERAIEIPIIWNIIQKNLNKKILEVGNVLSHYFPISHTVVDKYEVANGVINQDIINFNSDTQYDLIVGISTLEHIGWDETPIEPNKVIQAIEHLIELLAPNGLLVVTVPLGYNHYLDNLIHQGSICFSETYYLQRMAATCWIELSRENAIEAFYHYLLFYPNILLIGVTKKN